MSTVKDVEQALNDYEFDDGDSGWWMWQESFDVDEGAVEVEGLGTVKVIASEDAGEGDYEQAVYLVFEVTAPDGVVRHFKKNGFYQSYSGTSWDGDFYETKQAEKVITVWARA